MFNPLLKFLLLGSLCFYVPSLYAQDSLRTPRTLEEVFKLALANSYRLKISESDIRQARQQTEISRSNRLPALGTDLRYGYISNADIWSPSFTNHQTGAIPHQYTAFTTQAGQLIFKGGEITNTIKRSVLQEQVAQFAQQRDIQDVKFLVAAQYLDIYRLVSQQQIYRNNIRLTQNRLKNVLTMQKQGMVTQNDVLRTQLIISDFELSLRRVTNDIAILNQQLNVVTGLPDSARLAPDSTLLNRQRQEASLPTLLSAAGRENPDLKISAVNNRIAETNIRLLGSDRLPQVSLYALTNLQRPYTNAIPAVDIFTNVWQAGISLHYNIASLYLTKRRIRSGEIALEQSLDRETLDKQEITVAVEAAFTKYNESRADLVTLTTDLHSAEENYRVVEKKYFNQLALLTDMIDATNTKIEAELKVTTAQINVVYTYCRLLNTLGTL